MKSDEALYKAAAEARSDLRAIEDERDDRVRSARSAVHEEYRDRIAEARLAVHELERAVKEHKSQNATHKWEGKRVQKKVFAQTWSRHSSLIYGVVEVRRIEAASSASALIA